MDNSSLAVSRRNEIIERAARQLWDKAESDYWNCDEDCRVFDLNSADPEVAEQAQDWLKTVTEIADVLLPQLDTAEQVAALPTWTVLRVPVMNGWWHFHWDGSALVPIDGARQISPAWVLGRYGPLTVVSIP